MSARYGCEHCTKSRIVHFARYVHLQLEVSWRRTDDVMSQTAQTALVFTKSEDVLYESFDLEAMQFKDTRLAIYFETEEMRDETLILLKFNCPDTTCVYVATAGWNDLKLHVRSTHGKLMWSVRYSSLRHSPLLNACSIANCASNSRKSSRTSMPFILPISSLFICHPSRTAHPRTRHRMSRVRYIHYANSVENAISPAMSCLLTCVSGMKSALCASVLEFLMYSK